MAYTDLRKIFHADEPSYASEYESRITSGSAVKTGIDISGAPSFFLLTEDVYKAEYEASRLDKTILKLVSSLPGKAVTSYVESCLISEIVLTNEIEGVASTRKEIGEVLDRLKHNDKRGRFEGLVKKYLALVSGQEIPLQNCEDIRIMYDELVLDEVLAADKKDAPDGNLFRARPVSVLDEAGIPIHQGMEPEEKIKQSLEKALLLLNSDDLPPLARISAFHFLFGYIHPFYDGNGRSNRFISSYMISRNYEPIVGFRLSYAVKENISKYYKAYMECEHPLNKGDITPFVLAFSHIIVDAMSSMRDSLTERAVLLEKYTEIIERIFNDDANTLYLAEAFITAALFSTNGVTIAELADAFGISKQTAYTRMAPIKNMGLLQSEKSGKKSYYKMNLKELESLR